MSINSMTGYARLSGDESDLAWVWEVKSVNGRGLELRTKLPSGFDFLDMPVRDRVQKRFKRGNISLTLTVTRKIQQGSAVVNEALLDQLVAVAKRWQEKAPDLAAPRLDGLLGLRGVLDIAEGGAPSANDTELGPQLLINCDRVLEQLAKMRTDEGRRLAETLVGLLKDITGLVKDAANIAALDPAQLKAKLKSQVALLLDAGSGLSEDRLAQEVALLIGKADVREELDRLTAHLAAAGTMLTATEPVGRQLDFLCQEFNREANTLCSKASDISLTRIGLALKAAIEQFREQVQNIE